MGLTKDRLVFDATDLDVSDQVFSILGDSAGNLLTTTTVGADQALDVNVVQLTGAGIFAEDAAHTTGDLGQQILAVRQDTPGSLVDTDGDYAPLQVDATGNLRVAGTFASDSEFAEDSAHTSGDSGSFILAVRNDTQGSLVDTDGDYAPLQVDANGKLRTAADIEAVAVDGALTAQADASENQIITDLYRRQFVNDAPNIGGGYGAESVTTTAAEILATPEAGRTRILLQNLGNKDVYLGFDGSVTTANGLRLAKGSTLEVPFGEDIDIFAIAESGTQDVRFWELA